MFFQFMNVLVHYSSIISEMLKALDATRFSSTLQKKPKKKAEKVDNNIHYIDRKKKLNLFFIRSW